MHILQEKLLKVSTTHNLGKLSLREIGQLIGETAPQKVKHHLFQLEKRGLLQIDRSSNIITARQPGVVSRGRLVSVPVLGSANCGPAMIFAEQRAEGYLQISGKLLVKKKGIFAIKAHGYSMNKANINGESIEDGDYVVVDPEYRSLKNGDYVLSIIDGVANIKRYFKDIDNQRIILLSESSMSASPIFIHFQDLDTYIVNGKVVQVIKKPKTAWGKLKRFISSES
jgi:repressor LexA